MILKEATIGGVIYPEWIEGEKDLPESERVAFEYGPISNKTKVDLLHRTRGGEGFPNGYEICRAAIDANGKKIRNITTPSGEVLDTVEKLMMFSDENNRIAYMIELVGYEIWKRQSGQEVGLKN